MEFMDTSPYLSLFAACSYGIASMAMVFINKAVIMQYAHSMTLLALQQIATALLIHLGRVMGYTKARELKADTAKRLFPVSLFYNANVGFALASLKGVNIPMYIAIKRLTPLAVLVAGFFTGKGRPTTQVLNRYIINEKAVYLLWPAILSAIGFLPNHVPSGTTSVVSMIKRMSGLGGVNLLMGFSVVFQVTLSVLLIAAGVLIAALGDFSFDLFGYSLAFISVFFQTMYLVMVEKSGAEDGLSSIEIMFYNSFLSLPFLLFLIIVTGEFPNSLSLLLAKSSSISFLAILILSLVMGIVLNYTMFLCTIVNSALTTTIVGVLKGVGSTALGFIMLGGVEVHALNVTGLVINTAGGVWYSLAKYQQKKNKLPKIMSDIDSHRK